MSLSLTCHLHWYTLDGMKTWITYLAATAMGLAATLLFGETAAFQQLMYVISSLLVQFGGLILFPLVFVGFTAGIASLRKDARGGTFAWTTVLWSLCTTFLLAIVGAVIFHLLPVAFPATSSAGANTSVINSIGVGSLSKLFSGIFQQNPFYTLAISDGFLLPVIFLALILGYAIKPNVEVIRPAYVVINSFSEVMFRLAHIFTRIGYIFIAFFSASWFSMLWKDGTVFIAIPFMITFLVSIGVVILIILPLVYCCFTKFKKNPYRDIYRLTAPALAGLFSANIIFAGPSLIASTRHNLGAQKRISATAVPLYTIIGRGGSALIATFSVCSLLYAAMGAVPTWGVVLTVGATCALISFGSSMHLGYEVVFITVVALRMLNVNLYGAEMTLFGLLPLLNGAGILVDTLIGGLGTSATCDIMGTSAPAPYKDIL